MKLRKFIDSMISRVLIYVITLLIPITKKETVSTLFGEFMEGHDERKTNDLWRKQSTEFRKFWKNKIMNPEATYSSD